MTPPHSMVVVGLGFRIFVLIIVTSEALRSASFFLSVGLVMLGNMAQINRSLTNFGYRCERFRFYAVQFQIGAASVSKDLNHLVSFTFMSLFWVIVGLVWIVVKFSPATISLKFYIVYFSILAIVVVAVVCTLPLACKQVEANASAINGNIKRASWLHAKNNNMVQSVILRQAKCIIPMKIKCGSYGYLDNTFARTYFSDIILRCFDFILVFDARLR